MIINMKIMTMKINAITSTRDAGWSPPRSKSWWLGKSLTIITKREEKEYDDEHEYRDHKDQCSWMHKRCKMRTTKFKITTTKRVTNNCNKKRRRNMMINMRIVNNYKHKRCETRTIKIKITTIKRVTSSYSEKRRKGRQWSMWGPQPERSQTITSTRDARWGPPRSKSWWPRGLLVVVAKRKEKEDDDQHEEYDQEGCEQLQEQEMRDEDHQDQDHNDQEGH